MLSRKLLIRNIRGVTFGRRSPQDGGQFCLPIHIDRLLKRKPKMLVAIALANRMARQLWAMLTKGEAYKEPATPAVA